MIIITCARTRGENDVKRRGSARGGRLARDRVVAAPVIIIII